MLEGLSAGTKPPYLARVYARHLICSGQIQPPVAGPGPAAFRDISLCCQDTSKHLSEKQLPYRLQHSCQRVARHHTVSFPFLSFLSRAHILAPTAGEVGHHESRTGWNLIAYRAAVRITPFSRTTGTPVTRVTATDADDPVYGNSAKLVYSILDGQPYFSVDPNSATIKIALQGMDREVKEEYFVVIQAKDMGGHMGGLSGTTTVTIMLTDINDNPPKFSKSLYEFGIPEDLPIGKTGGKVKATDRDIGENAKSTYNIIEGDDQGTFEIITDAQTQDGILRLRKDSGEPDCTGEVIQLLDSGFEGKKRKDRRADRAREKDCDGVRCRGRLIMREFQRAPPTVEEWGLERLQGLWTLYDGPDVRAEAAWKSKPRVAVSFPPTAPPHPPTCPLLCCSSDLAPPLILHLGDDPNCSSLSRFVLFSSSLPSRFPSSGKARFDFPINPGYRPLDYESKKAYTLKVEATNVRSEPGSGGPFKDTATIKIVVEDADEPPVFSKPMYLLEVKENAPVATVIGRVAARDPDSSGSLVR
ncbi:hypothetical protein CCH79_00014395 [Gambusia affinis]|uniref:Cadherin domain-containing protein n=1 Tax=Gambusia affinis TaxID=33528 RepID=A0A315VE85_GAMAF|nr:hypothetical protein CCH79_00014395 [Gambusia affinis]